MGYRNGNYCAFYVDEPFNQINLGAASTRDFVTYNLLRVWKGYNSSFPFVDSHEKNYNVRDDSDWEKTLKPRLRERIRNSKNIVLILSRVTRNSRALREEIDYGINNQGLPVIVIYPDFTENSDIADSNGIRRNIRDLWNLLPVFRDSMWKVPTIHIPMKKSLIELALTDEKFMINSKSDTDCYYFTI
ncbi:MAG: TIR domain-containing protein [Lachnospiraceae bacterium]|nr:TIR domain-containing protein [Lachnospiraceae bacterium]